MPQRLTALEVSLLALDTAHTPGHVGTVDIFDPGGESFDYERLIGLIRDRIAFVPRYRQRVRGVPARLAGPVWVDDESFDLTFHVRRSALPRPGTHDQLREFVGRIMARRLDRSRPLWEVYLVEGLAGNQFALVAKSHLALVDGIDTVDLGQVLLDTDPNASGAASAIGTTAWQPLPEPSPVDLLIGALWESAQDPVRAVENLRGALTGTLGVVVAVGEAVGGGVSGALGELAADALRGPRPVGSPLAGAGVGATPVRHGADVPGRPQGGPGHPPAHHQRRGAGRDLRRTSLLAADPRRVDRFRQLADRVGPDERDRR